MSKTKAGALVFDLSPSEAREPEGVRGCGSAPPGNLSSRRPLLGVGVCRGPSLTGTPAFNLITLTSLDPYVVSG